MYGTGMDYGFGWIWPLILLAGVAALVWGISRGRSAGQGPGAEAGRDRSRAILRERFARGEISEQELQDRMTALDDD